MRIDERIRSNELKQSGSWILPFVANVPARGEPIMAQSKQVDDFVVPHGHQRPACPPEPVTSRNQSLDCAL